LLWNVTSWAGGGESGGASEAAWHRFDTSAIAAIARLANLVRDLRVIVISSLNLVALRRDFDTFNLMVRSAGIGPRVSNHGRERGASGAVIRDGRQEPTSQDEEVSAQPVKTTVPRY
jgi:hypothetical protein